MAYWASEKMLSVFDNKKISDYGIACNGFTTGNNDYFLRLWYEIDQNKIDLSCKNHKEARESGLKWFSYNKGGPFRKWYGNNDYVINWKDDGKDIKEYGHLVGRSMKYQFHKAISWSKISSSLVSFKIKDTGTMFDVAGLSLFFNNRDDFCYFLALCNSCYTQRCLEFLSPTLNYETGHIESIPVVTSKKYNNKIIKLAKDNIAFSKNDWDAFETSWDFKRHPLLQYAGFTPQMIAKEESNGYLILNGIADAYRHWEQACDDRFNQLKANEEELNRIFIDVYGLQDELTPEVEDKDVTVHRIFDTKDDVPESMQGSQYIRTKRDEVVSFISYAVGCMFGRYSLDVEGLVYAGGNYDSKYCRWIRQFGDKATEEIDENGNLIHGGWAGCTLWEYDGVKKDGKWIPASFAPDADNIIPICDDEYFEDDIVGRFVKFVEVVYGKETLQENLKFIADALGGKGQPKEVIRNYFLNGFYKDHCKMYQKRPIYWLFDSGKKNGFKCLIYMHRYEPDLLARIRTDYVHEQQSRYHAAIADLESRIDHATTAERVKLNKKLKVLTEQETEIHEYEEKIHHLADRMISIDPDDGVKNNYAIFKDVLAKIR